MGSSSIGVIMRKLHLFLFIALSLASSSVWAEPTIASINEDFSGIVFAMTPMLKVLSVLVFMMGIFAGIARQSFAMFPISMAAAIGLNSLPAVMASMLGIEPENLSEGSSFWGDLGAWILANLFYIGIGIVTVISEVVLVRRAAREFQIYKQQPVTRHWKQKLLTDLELAVNRLEDLHLIDRLNNRSDHEADSDQERSTIANLVRDIHGIKCFKHGSKPSLVGLKRTLKKNANWYKGYGGRSLENFRESIKGMPEDLDKAREALSDKPLYDDLLRSQVRRLTEKSGASLSLSKG